MRPFYEEIPRRVRRGYRGDPLRKYVRLFEVVSGVICRFQLCRWLYIKNYCLLSIIINYLLLSKMRRSSALFTDWSRIYCDDDGSCRIAAERKTKIFGCGMRKRARARFSVLSTAAVGRFGATNKGNGNTLCGITASSGSNGVPL